MRSVRIRPAAPRAGPEPAPSRAPAPKSASRWIRGLPNLLTTLRLGMAIAFPLAASAGRLLLVLASAFSDWLDGWIARRFDATSAVGALLDGIADKVFVITVLATLLWHGDIAGWQLPFVLARDVTVGVAFVYAMWMRRWDALDYADARTPGKLTTTVLFAWFVALLFEPLRGFALPLFVLGAACSIWAAVDYALRLAHFLHAGRARR